MPCCYDEHDPKASCSLLGHIDAKTAERGILRAIQSEWGHDQRYCDKIIARALVEHAAALRGLVEIIEAAGLHHLADGGVKLGATSWFVKASDRMSYAKSVLGEE